MKSTVLAQLLAQGHNFGGGFSLIAGILSAIAGYGLFTMKRWAWNLSFRLAILNIGLSFISLFVSILPAIVGFIMAILILCYLYQPHIRSAFPQGKAS